MKNNEKLEFLSHVYAECAPSFRDFCKTMFSGKRISSLNENDPVLFLYVFKNGSEDAERKMSWEERSNILERQAYLDRECDEKVVVSAGDINWDMFPKTAYLTDCTAGNLPQLRRNCRWDGHVLLPVSAKNSFDDRVYDEKRYFADLCIGSIMEKLPRETFLEVFGREGLETNDAFAPANGSLPSFKGSDLSVSDEEMDLDR